MLTRLFVIAGGATLAACTSYGSVALDGIVGPAASSSVEIRYALYPAYGYSAFDQSFPGWKDSLPAPKFQSMYTDDAGKFSTPKMLVSYDGPSRKPPPPIYWMSFSNEKDVSYLVGMAGDSMRYKAFAPTGAELKADEVCWAVVAGSISYAPEERLAAMTIQVEANTSTDKNCARAQ